MLRCSLILIVLGSSLAVTEGADKTGKTDIEPKPWYLNPVVRPPVPLGITKSANPIDAFVAAQHHAKGLKAAASTDRLTLLRRVHLDLTGLPPTVAEQDAFVQDQSAGAYDKVVDRLLASEQYGVRYARHWLDVLRYADVDEGMIAAPGIHLWRDWVIHALNSDLPYNQFVCAQLTGRRSTARTEVSVLGFRERVEPRPEDMFALGFLARGAVVHGDKEIQELPIAAVETVSTAFMGLTVGCAKCHDHEYDPITQRDFYTMKALFDPLALRKIILANPTEVIAHGKTLDALEIKVAAVQKPILELIAPFKQKLFDERVAQLPAEIRTIIRKSEKDRTAAEEKIADDYFPILRIDVGKIMAIMPEVKQRSYQALVKEYKQLEEAKAACALPIFWTVEVDHRKELEKSYILTSGDPARPQKKREVGPGWPFAPRQIDFRNGRIEAFADWLTAPDNPLFACVAVNRLWQWHFGDGLQRTPSDFGKLGGAPSNPKLLDWLASEFVERKFSMKAMHRLIVTSEAYKMASATETASADHNRKIDPGNTALWHFPLRRLDAETVWDAIFTAAGNLDLSLGGPSFDPSNIKPSLAPRPSPSPLVKRGAYMIRGYANNRDVMPSYLQAFDADDGRAPCPLRTHTVTAPQALFLMNSDVVDGAAKQFAERLKKATGDDLKAAVDLGYRMTLARAPSMAEMERSLRYLGNDPDRLPGFAWLLFNLDEFVFVR